MPNHFDTAAAQWDQNRMHNERTRSIAEAMIKSGIFRPGLRGLEFGAGTGLLSIALKDYVETLLLIDSSPEMVRVTQEKLDQQGIRHLHPQCIDLETQEFSTEIVDLLFSQMALHHVGQVPPMLKKFHTLLKPGGQLFIADLYSEDGDFHEGNPDVHHGFDLTELSRWCEEAGFTAVRGEAVFIMHKTMHDGILKAFPVFLLHAQRP